MSKRKSNSIKLLFVLMAMILAASFSFNRSTRAAEQDLPEGKGAELARDKCIICHEADLIVSQRLSRQGWVREVEKMIRWGATVSEAEKEILVEYFAAHFKPRSAAANAAITSGEDRGKQIFEEKCLVCHEADLTEQQRLSRQGWVREVEKMVRWGASVTAAEKDPLVDYLTKNYGSGPLKTSR
jgi:mono/diheme cytochrome c family protein